MELVSTRRLIELLIREESNHNLKAHTITLNYAGSIYDLSISDNIIERRLEQLYTTSINLQVLFRLFQANSNNFCILRRVTIPKGTSNPNFMRLYFQFILEFGDT